MFTALGLAAKKRRLVPCQSNGTVVPVLAGFLLCLGASLKLLDLVFNPLLLPTLGSQVTVLVAHDDGFLVSELKIVLNWTRCSSPTLFLFDQTE